MKTLQLGDELLIRAFFACFLFIKRTIVFFELFLIHLHDGTLRYPFVIHQHLFHLKYPRPFPLTFDRERYLEFQ